MWRDLWHPPAPTLLVTAADGEAELNEATAILQQAAEEPIACHTGAGPWKTGSVMRARLSIYSLRSVHIAEATSARNTSLLQLPSSHKSLKVLSSYITSQKERGEKRSKWALVISGDDILGQRMDGAQKKVLNSKTVSHKRECLLLPLRGLRASSDFPTWEGREKNLP